MSTLDIALILLAFTALLGIIFEAVTHINKTKMTLFLGTLSWIQPFRFSPDRTKTAQISRGLAESISKIAGAWT